MKSRFSYILISVLMLGFLLVPFSPLIIVDSTKIAIKIESRVALAETRWYYEFQPPLGGSNVMSVGYATETECNAASQVTSQSGGTIVRNCFSSETTPTATGSEDENNGSEKALKSMLRTCGISRGSFIIGCFIQIMYFLFVSIPSWLMTMTAQVFDTAAALTLSDQVYRSGFINTIWTIVRDFSNVFFILILLYAAFQVILGLGHGGGKKIVASVILIALMVNFSLFISRVVVDAGNVLGLIFYNKISTDHVDYKPVTDPTLTNVPEKDLAGALVSGFEVNNFFSAKFFEGLEGDPKNWETAGCTGGCVGRTINNWLAASLIVTYGLIAYSLAWTFLVVGISFIGRMATLIMLMVISPIAFVTASVPTFKGIDTIGFDSWLKKLFKTSFVVAVFMAILYLISEILKADIFDSYSVGQAELGVAARIMLIFVPALLIIIFLQKGKEYAMKASGEITGALMSGAKILGGLALGGGALVSAGAAWAGRNTMGSVNKYIQNDASRKKTLSGGDFKDAWTYNKNWKKYSPLHWAGSAAKTVSATGKYLAAGTAKSTFTSFGIKDKAGKPISLGRGMQAEDKALGNTEHAKHELDGKSSELAHKWGMGKDTKYSDLTDNQKMDVREAIDKDTISKQTYKKKYDALDANEARTVDNAMLTRVKDAKDSNKMDYSIDAILRDPADPSKFKTQTINKSKVDSGDSFDKYSKAKVAMGQFVRALRQGSYDVRNLSDIKNKGPMGVLGAAMIATGIGAPIGAAMLAGTTGVLRNGLKKYGADEYGKGNKNFLKDLSDVLSGAVTSTLKNAKIEAVKVDHGGGGHDDHGGGHGGGGHH